METAVQRRCEQELGFRTALKYLYKFEYTAQFGELGSERELCSVFVGFYSGIPEVNGTEIQAWRWLPQHELDANLSDPALNYTPWFKLEWQRLSEEFANEIPSA